MKIREPWTQTAQRSAELANVPLSLIQEPQAPDKGLS